METELYKLKPLGLHKTIQSALKRVYGLDISHTTILDLIRRAADAIQSEYDAILIRIRNAQVLYIDETSIKVQSKTHWIWVFAKQVETFVAIRKSRGIRVLLEVLTRQFKGIIVAMAGNHMLNSQTISRDAGLTCSENPRI